MKAIDRIYEYLAVKGIKPTVIEKEIGLSNGYLSVQRKRNADIGEGVLNKIIDYCRDVSPVWLLTGHGEMMTPAPPVPETSASFDNGIYSVKTKTATPYYDVDFVGGFDEVFNDQTIQPDGYINVPGFERAELWCNVRGNSMFPIISNGDLIALRRCSFENIKFGEIYAVVMDELRTIKKIRSSESPDQLRFIPVNPDYDEQTYDKKRILYVFEVLGSISRFF
jgi:hypothetical protein